MKRSIVSKIVLNIPHSSSVFPFGKEAWEHGIEPYIDLWTDTCTDYIFGTSAITDQRIEPVIFPWSRFFCDVERLEHDKLEKKGQGIVYSQFEGIRRQLQEGDKDNILKFYNEHFGKLRGALTQDTLLVDCHSFPPHVAPKIDICIGYNFDWSCPDKDTLQTIKSFFSGKGYSVYCNKPYSNAVAPAMPFSYKSVMIELNKELYLDSSGNVQVEKMNLLRNQISELFRSILDEHTNLYGTFVKTFPTLWEHRKEVLSNLYYYSSDIGFRVYGVGLVTLGMLFEAIESNRELFTAQGWHHCGTEMIITGFSGSPLSGTCSVDAICPICGDRRVYRTCGFGARARAVAAVKKGSQTSSSFVPVAVISKIFSSGDEVH